VAVISVGPVVRVKSFSMSLTESANAGDHMAIAGVMLLGSEKSERLNWKKMLLGPGHCDIEQTTLFVEGPRATTWCQQNPKRRE